MHPAPRKNGPAIVITPKGSSKVQRISPVYTAEQIEWNDTVYWFTEVVPRWTGRTMSAMIRGLRDDPVTVVPCVFIGTILAEMTDPLP